jgi:hypothetical protein
MSVSLSDILTAAKNIVTALNNQAQTTLSINGLQTVSNISAATLVKSSGGRLATVSVVVAGSAPGAIYDSNNITVKSSQLFSVPNTLGVTFVNMPTTNGIVVAPGPGQTVSVSYS